MGERYAIGIDFGTESGRALLVDVSDGREVAAASYRYRNGVIDDHLPAPDDDVRLAPDWALQDPTDYINTLKQTVPSVLRQAGARAADIVGIGIDFTACTLLPTNADGEPLCTLPRYRREPHAWVKLWKHHAAQPQADCITRTAEQQRAGWLQRYGGKISSEWFFSKCLQILDEAPHIYDAADRLIEAADWVVWQMTGTESRNSCTAGYKAIWSKGEGFPPEDYFAALDPRFAGIVDDKMSRQITSIGSRAGALSEEAAGWMGLRPGTPVAVANVDAHVSVPAATVVQPGRMVAVAGTSTCHLVLADQPATVPGICGVVEDGIIPGLFGYEAGQASVGDIFAWFVDHAVPPQYHQAAAGEGVDLHVVLEREAARLRPGESGLLALDWWNGNRSILVDVDLTGLLLGATLATRAPHIYRSLLEATAFGTRVIVESFEAAGIRISEIVACGGLPQKNRLLMQIYADVTGKVVRVAASTQVAALGSAMFGAVAAGSAAGGYDSIAAAAQRMARLSDERFAPDPSSQAIYDQLYAEYRRLHDYFGRGDNQAMKSLKAIRAQAIRAQAIADVSRTSPPGGPDRARIRPGRGQVETPVS